MVPFARPGGGEILVGHSASFCHHDKQFFDFSVFCLSAFVRQAHPLVIAQYVSQL